MEIGAIAGLGTSPSPTVARAAVDQWRITVGYANWIREFEHNRACRAHRAAPPWQAASPLPPALVRSLQRFQAGEDGDGRTLIGKSERAGDAEYLAAVRLFIAEEQNHARMLKRLLLNAGASTIDGHWTDRVFVIVRRALGLRTELMVLMLAEVVALRYYRALRDGTTDPAVTVVAARILADEERHVPFHLQRLRDGFGEASAPVRGVAAGGWWMLMIGALAVVALDHGSALRTLGVPARRFVADVLRLFRPMVAEVFGTVDSKRRADRRTGAARSCA